VIPRAFDRGMRQVHAGGPRAVADPLVEVGTGSDTDLENLSALAFVKPGAVRAVRLELVAGGLDLLEVPCRLRGLAVARSAGLTLPMFGYRLLENGVFRYCSGSTARHGLLGSQRPSIVRAGPVGHPPPASAPAAARRLASVTSHQQPPGPNASRPR